MRVLLVEDDPGVREALELGLSLEGHEVRAVDRPEEALGLLSWAEVVVLDVLLPQGDGFSLLRAIRERSEVPVLMPTALDGVEWRVKGLREGADDYLVKPFGRSRLREALARFRAFQNLKAKKEVSQADVDRLLGRRQAPKGLDPLTLGRVLALLQGGKPLTAEEVAEALGLSRVTAWRYLEALRREGRVRAEPRYGGTGRPSRAYRLEPH